MFEFFQSAGESAAEFALEHPWMMVGTAAIVGISTMRVCLKKCFSKEQNLQDSDRLSNDLDMMAFEELLSQKQDTLEPLSKKLEEVREDLERRNAQSKEPFMTLHYGGSEMNMAQQEIYCKKHYAPAKAQRRVYTVKGFIGEGELDPHTVQRVKH